jgi:hypothetical protein
MNQVVHSCKCKMNGGWLDIKSESYEIKCNNCKRKYIVNSDGTVKEGLLSRILHFIG